MKVRIVRIRIDICGYVFLVTIVVLFKLSLGGLFDCVLRCSPVFCGDAILGLST